MEDTKGEGKRKIGRKWAHHQVEQAIDGEGRILAGAKGAIEVCVYLHSRRTKIIRFRGPFARVANRCFS